MTYKVPIWPNFLLRRQILEKQAKKLNFLLKLGYFDAKSVLKKWTKMLLNW